MPSRNRKCKANSTTVTSGFTTATASKLKFLGRQALKHEEAISSGPSNPNACIRPESIEAREEDEENDDDVFGELETELEAIEINNSNGIPGQQHLLESLLPDTIVEENEHEPAEGPSNWQEVKKKEKRKTVGPTPANRFLGSALTVPNWRERNGAGVHGSRYIGARTAGGQSYVGNGGPAYAVGPWNPMLALREGMIIWHMYTQECYNPGTTPNGYDTFRSKDGQLHIRKGRYFYVLSRARHYTNELPLYTYIGKGLAEKSEDVKKEHVGVRPTNVIPGEYLQQNEYTPLEVDFIKDESDQLHPKTVLHFAQSRSASYDSNIRIVGALTQESVARVRQLRAQLGC